MAGSPKNAKQEIGGYGERAEGRRYSDPPNHKIHRFTVFPHVAIRTSVGCYVGIVVSLRPWALRSGRGLHDARQL